MIPIDLILMDCQMPVMDGMEATRRIRNGEAGERNSLLPIIAMTAHAFAKDKERCTASGMDDYLTKPVQATILTRMVARWFGHSHGNTDQAPLTTESSAPPAEKPEFITIFNPDDLLSRMGDDRELAQATIAIFLEGNGTALLELRHAMENQDIDTVAMQAHGLKGAALNSGAGKIAELARQLEFLAREGSLNGADHLIADLAQETTRYRIELQRTGWIQTGGAA